MTEVKQNVVTQNPRDYTVQIRTANGQSIVGTGVVVDATRVVTCIHVIKMAGAPLCAGSDGEVAVYFPQALGGEEKTRKARVCACFDAYDDDVVLLELTDGTAPLGPEKFGILGRAERSSGDPFRAYGYKRLGKYQAGYAYGTVMGCVECPSGFRLQADPVELNSPHLAAGMSGSGVLDTERNLIVGLVSEVFHAEDDKNRDVGWAVNARVLAFDPLNLSLADAQPKTAAPTPPELPDPRMALLRPTKPAAWHGAPPVLDEWVGREELLRALNDDWESAATRITVLVGFGGEGKSSLAREWVQEVTSQKSKVKSQTTATSDASRFTPPDAVFWWSFYDEASVDAFAESLLDYLGGGRIKTQAVPSAAAKLELCARLLQGGRVLLALDGFEVMQHQGGEGPEGDRYGLIQSSELRRFLEYLAAPESAAFCLITSRAPLLDLLPYTTCTQRDVTRLSPADGRALLRELGVQGPDKALDAVVRAWDGHALTLSLLGSLLAERHGGDLARLDDLPLPTADETKYERVHRVLRRYDEHLTGAERDVLKRFSLFRTPVTGAAFERVSEEARKRKSEKARKRKSEEAKKRESEKAKRRESEKTKKRESEETNQREGDDLEALINRLIAYRLLRHNPRDQTYTTHPLIRSHYLALFTKGEPDATRAAHERIKDYYLGLAGDTPHFPTLDDLRPLIEVVHHACRAGAYDEAWDIYWQRVIQRDRRVLIYQLGAYETTLSLTLEFFPNSDPTQDPLISDLNYKRFILNEVGLCLMSLGRLREAVPFYERKNAMPDGKTSVGYRNLASLHIYLGDLLSGAEAAREALALARKAENKQDECKSLAWLAWAEHLRGESEAALAHFAEVEALYQETEPDKKYAYSLPGIWHAEALLRASLSPTRGGGKARVAGGVGVAQRITEANLEICEQYHWADDLSMCHRVLGDILTRSQPSPEDGAGEQKGDARRHYDEALRIARSISYRPALIEALLARGDPQGFQNLAGLELDTAFDNLNEALGYAIQGGYKRYEADIRAALARAYQIQGDPARAREQGLRARALSEAMGYHLREIENGEW